MTDTADETPFDDLITANRSFAQAFALARLDGVARAGVAMVTCMDSRIDPLAMIGLAPGDAKILRTPGGRLTDPAFVGLVLAVNLLQVERVLVVQHTRCAMSSATEQQLSDRLSEASRKDASWMSLGVITDRLASITDDVHKLRAHPLVPSSVAVGGFVYDVDTGLLGPVT
ncbi:MAG: beta-class carbonic anhydrase [Nocardioidaceae bacterium]